MRTVDFTIVRGMNAGVYVPNVEGEVVLLMVSPQDNFPLIRISGTNGVITLDHRLTSTLGFKVADYYVWDSERKLLQRGRIRVHGPYPDEVNDQEWQVLRFVGRGPHQLPAEPKLVFVNGVLYHEYELLTEGLYLPDAGLEDEITVVL